MNKVEIFMSSWNKNLCDGTLWSIASLHNVHAVCMGNNMSLYLWKCCFNILCLHRKQPPRHASPSAPGIQPGELCSTVQRRATQPASRAVWDLYIVVHGSLTLATWNQCTTWVKFILRPTVCRPVRLGIGFPFEAHDQILSLSFL
jgi:hypothetical protein